MDETAAIFILLMTGMSMIFWLINGLIKNRRHATPSPAGGSLDAQRQVELLTRENGRLEGQVSRLEERIAVLERIAVDPAQRTAREIENLR